MGPHLVTRQSVVQLSLLRTAQPTETQPRCSTGRVLFSVSVQAATVEAKGWA